MTISLWIVRDHLALVDRERGRASRTCSERGESHVARRRLSVGSLRAANDEDRRFVRFMNSYCRTEASLHILPQVL